MVQKEEEKKKEKKKKKILEFSIVSILSFFLLYLPLPFFIVSIQLFS